MDQVDLPRPFHVKSNYRKKKTIVRAFLCLLDREIAYSSTGPSRYYVNIFKTRLRVKTILFGGYVVDNRFAYRFEWKFDLVSLSLLG